MQVSVQSTGGLEKRMQVELPAADVEREIDQELTKLSRTARLKGFRPGKAPIRVVRQQFGERVRAQVVDDLLRSSFVNAVTQENLRPAGDPRIEGISAAKGEGLRYAAVFEVMPQVELKSVDGFQVERPRAEVSEADIDAMVESLRQQRPNWQEVARAARSGDRLSVDFDGTIEAVAFPGGKGENVTLILGSGRMLPEFENGLAGAAPGETRTIAVNFPADYHSKELAGKTAQFSVHVRRVDEAQLPELDDEFFKAYGVAEGGIDALRRDVAENMRGEAEEVVRARVKKQVLDRLLAANPVELPRTLVENQIRQLQIDAARRIGARDVSQIPPGEQFEEAARRRVGLGLLVNELIRRENLKVDRARVDTHIAELVAGHDQPAEMTRAYLENAEAMRQIESMVLEDQVVDWLLARARIEEKAVPFKELMSPGSA